MLQVPEAIVLFIVHGYAFAIGAHPDIVIFIAIQTDDHITADAVGISFFVLIPFELFGKRVEPVQSAAIGAQPNVAVCAFTYAQQFVMAKAID
jgi:hypothetical protein